MGRTALHDAVSSGPFEAVNLLLLCGQTGLSIPDIVSEITWSHFFYQYYFYIVVTVIHEI